MIEQREIVEFNVLTLTSAPGPHPCVIISTNETFVEEGFHYAVMLSTKTYNGEFEFEITPEMVTNETNSTSYAKTQIIVQIVPSMVMRRSGRLKRPYFNEMMQLLNKEVFGIECQPE